MTGLPPPARLRLASWNIRKAVGLDWRRDPERVVRVLASLDADVVALQEADRRLAPRPGAIPREMIEAAGFRIVPLARSAVSLGWHGNAILIRSGIGVAGTAHVALPGIEPRGAVRADLDTPLGRLTVMGVHLGLRAGCRRLQYARLMGHLGQAAPDGVPAFSAILGDFNEWTAAGAEGLAPAFRLVLPGRSFHAARPMACLDRIALGRGLDCAASGVLMGGEAARASDHLPIWADVTASPP